MMITRIYVDNFLCLGNFEFRPKQLNLLLGENGSGKTSLFFAVKLVRDLVVLGASAASLFAFKKTIWDRRDLQSFELEIEGLDGTFSYRLEIQHPPREAPQKPHIKGEYLDFDGRPLFRYGGGEVHLSMTITRREPFSHSNRSTAFFPTWSRRIREFDGSRTSLHG